MLQSFLSFGCRLAIEQVTRGTGGQIGAVLGYRRNSVFLAQQRQCGVTICQYSGRIDSQPIVDHGRVYTAEISVKLQIAAAQLSQRRMPADNTRAHSAAEHKQRRGLAVVRAIAAVLCQTSAEFRKRHPQDTVQLSARP